MSNTPETGYYVLRNAHTYGSLDTTKVYYHSLIEKNQIAALDRDMFVKQWKVPPRFKEAPLSIPYRSSITCEDHFHYLDFICQFRTDQNNIHLIENKPSSLIEASYNVEPVIDQIATGKRAIQSLTKHEQYAIAVRDKRLATEHFVKFYNNDPKHNPKIVYHLTYHFNHDDEPSIPSTYHELILPSRTTCLHTTSHRSKIS